MVVDSDFAVVDWEYRTEGGQSAVFRYKGSNPKFLRHVLRLRSVKRDKKQCLLPHCDEKEALNALMCTEVSPYLLRDRTIHIRKQDAVELGKLAEESRPLERRNVNSMPDGPVNAVIQKDLASLFGRDTLCVEVKPKCAVLARSRLIPPELSKTLRKFALLDTHVRNFKLQDVCKGLAEGTLYNPLDLMSGESLRIRHALKCLQKSKSRWLRVLSSGSFIATTNDVACLLAKDVYEYDGALCNKAIHLASDALAETTDLMNWVLRAQKLDGIDKFGLRIMWERVVEGIGQEDAAKLVWTHYLEGRSMSQRDDDSEFEMWTQKICYESSTLALFEHNQIRFEQAMEAVKNMPLNICARFIADCMFAGMAKDCSIIVSLAPARTDVDYCDQDSNGLEAASLIDPEDGVKWQYKVHVIDVGPKPLTKIECWRKLDQTLLTKVLDEHLLS